MKRSVWVGRSNFRQWEIEVLPGGEMPNVHEPVMIHFYLDHKEKPVPGYVSKIVDEKHYIVRRGQRQTPKL